MKRVQVFLITRNRQDTVGRAIDSILNQSYIDYELVVSDNSTNDLTQKFIEEKYSERLIYKRRVPQYDSGVDHINQILKEVKSNLFMVFHDDDEMLPCMIESLVRYHDMYPKIVAVGANAYNVIDGRISHPFFKRKRDVLISTPDDLIRKYLNRGIVPFPSFLYRRIPGMVIDVKKGGKYSDVAFLTDLVCRGQIIYCKKPLMKYYRHQGQDSASFSFHDSIMLCNYLKKCCADKKLLFAFRLSGVYLNMRFYYPFLKPAKGYKLLLLKSPFNYFIKYNLLKLLSILKQSPIIYKGERRNKYQGNYEPNC